MKKVLTILLFSFSVFAIQAQSIMASSVYSSGRSYSLQLFLDIDENSHDKEALFHHMADELELLRQKALQKYHKDTIFWLEKVFYTVQRKELKEYKNYVSLSTTLNDQQYDCVTGTAVYALLLDQLEIPYQIIEFPHHVSLLLNFDGKQIMLESTDPIYGYVVNQKEINERIEFYQSENSTDEFPKNINLRELAGLHFYNQSVVAYNNFHFVDALECLEKANALYPSERISQLKYQIESIWSDRLTASN